MNEKFESQGSTWCILMIARGDDETEPEVNLKSQTTLRLCKRCLICVNPKKEKEKLRIDGLVD